MSTPENEKWEISPLKRWDLSCFEVNWEVSTSKGVICPTIERVFQLVVMDWCGDELISLFQPPSLSKCAPLIHHPPALKELWGLCTYIHCRALFSSTSPSLSSLPPFPISSLTSPPPYFPVHLASPPSLSFPNFSLLYSLL